jgi:superfamily I DNA/RNA helicase
VTSPQDDAQRAPVLNAEQQRVCTYEGGSQVVVAGPGTGKTRTLLHRIAHLIDVKGVKPTSILALTFSNRAAQEIRDRITTLCPHMPPENAPKVTTFHKLGYGLIREHFSRLGFPAAPAVMSEDERKRRLLFEAAKRSGDDIRTNDIELSAIARIAAGEPMVHPAQFLAAIDTREASAARRRYQDALVDFCDLLLFPLFLFSEDDAIRTHYRAQWPCIFVDEYQDINALQYRLITLLCDASHEICAIGDPDQAIYGFRGADPSYFLRFQSDFPASCHTVLQKNYRCSERICAAAAGVIGPIRAHDTPQYSMAPNGPHVRITGLATEAAEAEHIVCRIEELIGGSSFFARDSERSRHEGDETIGFNDIAILTRTHAVADPIEHALRRSSIPCQRVRKSSLIGDKGLQAALALLRMVTAAHSRMHAMHLFSFSLPGLSGKIRTLLSTYLHTADDSDQPILTRLKSQDGLSHTARRGLAALEESGEHIAYACASGNMRSALETAARATGTSDDRLRERPWNFFLRYAQGFDTIDDFLSTIALDIDNDFFDPRAQGVTLTTLHAAKGCEWPVVFIAGCEDGLLPLRDFGREADHDEERRLLYVGMTRAQSTLECTYARVRSRRGTSRSSRRLSPFLENLSPRQVTHACIESPKKHRGIRTEQLDLFSQ